MQKAIFLDRDGVLNEERGTYTFRLEDFIIPTGVVEALKVLHQLDYRLIVVTNQGGINKGLYSKEDVFRCHQYLQQQCGYIIDALYYSPYHSDFTHSLSRKPDSLMLEKAVAKFGIDVGVSWLIGDSERDVLAGKKVGVKTALVNEKKEINTQADVVVSSLWHLVENHIKTT